MRPQGGRVQCVAAECLTIIRPNGFRISAKHELHVIGVRYVFDSRGQAGPRMGAASLPY